MRQRRLDKADQTEVRSCEYSDGAAEMLIASAALEPLTRTPLFSKDTLFDRLVLPVQKIASGFSGDPVPFSIRNGAAMNRNS
jgi:hypothetical protein